MGALQEIMGTGINNRPVNNEGMINRVKYLIWVPWISLFVLFLVLNGGISTIEPFYYTNHGISVTSLFSLGIYFVIITITFGIAVVIGRRGSCHAICHMAVFMILGRKLRNIFFWPSLHLEPLPETCSGCKRCSRVCPMSIDVETQVKSGIIEHPECILCGNCVDNCPKKVIKLTFS
jgi:polyferredoxin